MVDISVIVPVYNVEKYIERCILSVKNQIFTNWELILIDDGSKDSSGKICDYYASLDKRIKVIHQNNKGVSAARNLGIEKAIGNYITFIDGDDWIENDLFEMMIKSVKKMNVPILLTGAVQDFGTEAIKLGEPGVEQIFIGDEIQLEYLKGKRIFWSIWAQLFKRNLFKKNRFNSNFKYAEDILMCCNLLDSVNKIGYVPLYKYHYDISASGTVSIKFNSKWLHSLRAIKSIYDKVKIISPKHAYYGKIMYVNYIFILIDNLVKSNMYKKRYIADFLRNILKSNLDIIFYKKWPIKMKIRLIFFAISYQTSMLFLLLKNIRKKLH